MRDFLQYWGGIWFIANKFALCACERSEGATRKWWNPPSWMDKRQWKIYSWIFYLVGLPAWLFIFMWEHNWIVLMVEAGGIMPVVLALTIAIKGLGKQPAWLDKASKAAVILGILASFIDKGFLISLEQYLELGSTVGFLIGTSLLAKQNNKGYLWYLLMNGSMGWLVAVQGYWVLAAQQALSLVFVLDAYVRSRRTVEM